MRSSVCQLCNCDALNLSSSYATMILSICLPCYHDTFQLSSVPPCCAPTVKGETMIPWNYHLCHHDAPTFICATMMPSLCHLCLHDAFRLIYANIMPLICHLCQLDALEMSSVPTWCPQSVPLSYPQTVIYATMMPWICYLYHDVALKLSSVPSHLCSDYHPIMTSRPLACLAV